MARIISLSIAQPRLSVQHSIDYLKQSIKPWNDAALCIRVFFFRTAVCLMAGATLSLLSSCSAVQGYPNDPENRRAVLATLQPYFSATEEERYANETDATRRRQLRDQIVLNRVRAYDLQFAKFEESLYGSGSAITTGGDLIVLILSGLGATIAGSATKAALAAASAGIVGAQATLNKDLYYQRTLPALMAQMEANRATVELAIFFGLTQDDNKYSLPRADLDLEALQQAGSIPRAVTSITQQAANANDAAQSKINALRVLTFSRTETSKRIRDWLYPHGQVDASGNPVAPDPTNFAKLQAWMNNDSIDPRLKNIPEDSLIDGSDSRMESDRTRAIADLKIP